MIHGLRVYGGNGELKAVCKQHNIDVVVISSLKMSNERIEEVIRSCNENEIAVKRMRITIEELNSL